MTEPVISKLKTLELLHIYAQRECAKIDRLSYEDEIDVSEFAAHPADIFRINQRDPLVHSIIHYWLDGYLTWEQALMKCVVLLSEQVQFLMREKEAHWARNPMPPFYVTLHDREEDSE